MRSILFGFIFICFVQPLLAQNNVTGTYQEWNLIASKAEETLANNESTTLSLEELRVELSESRSTFLELREEGGTRLRSLKAQLVALGPEPAEDEVESIEISDRRTALKQQIKLEAVSYTHLTLPTILLV